MSLVMKFGGSSVADAACLRRVAALVAERADARPLVVLSAMGKTTNGLFTAARLAESGDLDGARAEAGLIRDRHRQAVVELFDSVPPQLAEAVDALFTELDSLLQGVAILGELSPRSLDAVVSVGERLSTRIFAAATGLPWIDARTAMRTDSEFGNAAVDDDQLRDLVAAHVAPVLADGSGAVTQGYIGADAAGHTTTLGRGGSDYSAALFGAALGVAEVQIWTDVEGLLTCDPRVVAAAQSVTTVSAAEAAELAAFGAKVLHPATIAPAIAAGATVTIRDTQHPHGSYTTVAPATNTGRAATALATRGPVAVLTIRSNRMLNQAGFLATLFDVFRRHRLSVGLIATAEVSVSMTVDGDADLSALLTELSAFADVTVDRDRAIVALVGDGLKRTRGLAARFFGALTGIDVELISLGANEINMSIVVAARDANDALRSLHREFFEEAA